MLIVLVPSLLLRIFWRGNNNGNDAPEERFITYIVDPQKQQLKFYWKDRNGKPLRSIENLMHHVENQQLELIFAMNGGMYDQSNAPVGLFIEDGITIHALDTTNGKGNFYLKPNGVFFLTDEKRAGITVSADFNPAKVHYATQSGPMLIIGGKIHPSFNPTSQNLNIRNGVGMLPNNKILFVMSKQEISLYDFATYFKRHGCENALYLDGLVSRTYLPEKQWIQTDGDFGLMIGVTKKIGSSNP